jgi:hypothetical protein
VSVEAVIVQALERRNWIPGKNYGFPEEMDYIQKMRKSGLRIHACYRGSQRFDEVEATVPPGEGPAIHLQIYADELDRDLMGFSSGRNKIHVIYAKIHNLTDGICRTPEDYHLLQVMPSFTLKSNGYNDVMTPMITDISEVVEKGIEYRGRRYPVRLATLQGDGLERASMFGMAGNFSTLSHCDPLSYLTTKTRLECQNVKQLVTEVVKERTKDSYEEDISNLHERERRERALKARRNLTAGRRALKSKYEYSRGMKFESPFHKVGNFHVTDKGAVIYCIGHDLYSGTFRSDMARVLLALCNAKYFLWSDLQDKFRTHRRNLTGDDSHGWYDVICIKTTFKQLPGNHSSNHLVIRFLSTLWINRKPNDAMFKTTAWAMYLTMKRIAELVSAKVVTDGNRTELQNMVYKYLEVNESYIFYAST